MDCQPRKSNYWNTEHVYPAKIVIRQYVDENARLNALKTGVVDYTYITPTTYPTVSTDNVTVRDARDNRTVAGVLGGGMKYHVSPRWGIRLDARVSLSKNAASTA